MVEFDHFRKSAGLPSFVLSASEWIERTNAIGIVVKKGCYGGTYAHKDIAFEFGSAISVPFKLYLIEEFQNQYFVPRLHRKFPYHKSKITNRKSRIVKSSTGARR
ncbi:MULTISPECIES: KilA-N domain-containing protein [Butyricimonas]|uniref:KilA-N domain-containing protein n=1 Tax=Butyricimonas TaxID=574697 RepID=UPI003510B961